MIVSVEPEHAINEHTPQTRNSVIPSPQSCIVGYSSSFSVTTDYESRERL